MLSDISPPYLWRWILSLLKIHCTVTFTEGEWSHRQHRSHYKHGVPDPRPTTEALSYTHQRGPRVLPSPKGPSVMLTGQAVTSVAARVVGRWKDDEAPSAFRNASGATCKCPCSQYAVLWKLEGPARGECVRRAPTDPHPPPLLLWPCPEKGLEVSGWQNHKANPGWQRRWPQESWNNIHLLEMSHYTLPFSIRQRAGRSVGAPTALPQWARPGSPRGHPSTCALPTLHLLPDDASHTASLLREQVTGGKPSGPALWSL